MKYKVAFKTLGCRLNQYETDAILTDFYKAGYEIVPFNQPADVYIINTCTITNQGDHKSKTAINKAVRGKDGALIIVTGCLAENQRSYLENRGDISYIIDNKKKARIQSIVQAHFNREINEIDNNDDDVFSFSVAEKSFHTRGMVKIQDGCNNFCSYCIVPVVRGAAVSRPASDILENIRQLIDLDYKEVVLTGVNISDYEFNGISFTHLLEKIIKLQGDFRLRISSIEPQRIDEGTIELFSEKNVCPHLHLCLQSGSDKILRSMRRTYSVSSYMHIIDIIRKRYPLFNFTTDIIVGFPGETEDDFNDSCQIIKDVGFSHVHTFKYSVRSNTRAETLPDHIPEKIRQERSRVIRDLALELKLKYRKSFLGKQQTVLVEKVNRQGLAKGYGEHYIPVEFPVSDSDTNYFRKVSITQITGPDNDFILQANIM